MITDNNIDKSTAKFWCIFADKELKSQLKKAHEFSKKNGKNLKNALISAQDKVESLKDESECVQETKGSLDGSTFMGNFMNPQNMIGMSGNPFCPNFRTDAPLSLEDQQRNSVIAGAAVAAGAAVVANPGAWGAAAMGLINGTSQLSGIVAQVGLAGLSAGLVATIGGIVSISSWLYPRMTKWVKDLSRTRVIARCEFAANGTPYVAVYSLSKSKWQLLYGNSRWFRRGVIVDETSVDSFFASQFFQRFASQCEKYMSTVLNDDDNFEALKVLAKMADKNSAKDIKMIIDNKAMIEKNMYSGLYMSESICNKIEK